MHGPSCSGGAMMSATALTASSFGARYHGSLRHAKLAAVSAREASIPSTNALTHGEQIGLQASSVDLASAVLVAAASASMARPRGERASRRRRRRKASKVVCRAADEKPIFASVLSKQKEWRAAVAEIGAEARYRTRGRATQDWTLGVAFIQGHEGASIVKITETLDTELGTNGAILGVAVDGCSGTLTDGTHGVAGANQEDAAVLLSALRLPTHPEAAAAGGLQSARPFFVGKDQLMEISHLVCRLQAETRVRGAVDSANRRAWQRYLGAEGMPVKGILIFIDPMASKYVANTVLAGLDMAFPDAVKFGGASADRLPSFARLAVNTGGGFKAGEAGVSGLILPSSLSLHTIVSPGSVRVGPELRLTRAQGQVVSELNDEPAAQVLTRFCQQAPPLERMLIERSGFLLGLEAPKQLDAHRSKVYDDQWGSSARAPSYSQLQRQTSTGDWIVRSIEKFPDGTIMIRREDLKRVPPRVGPAWLRCQLHVHDGHQAREELRLMLQRYLGARMLLQRAQPPLGALICACASWTGAARARGDGEVGYKELQEILGKDLEVAGLVTTGELAPAGVALGGMDQKRTLRQGHSASCCILSYEP